VCEFFRCVAINIGIYITIMRVMGPLCKVLPLIGFSDVLIEFQRLAVAGKFTEGLARASSIASIGSTALSWAISKASITSTPKSATRLTVSLGMILLS